MYLANINRIPSIEGIKNYKIENLHKDFMAALTGVVVAIPQCMAYALIAGLNPVYGLYTAIVSAIFGATFGSSKHLITGPTNSSALLVASVMKNYMGLDNAYQMVFLLTFLVGAFKMLFGILKLGRLISYVSHSVIIGFTTGAGCLIALGQLSTLLSIPIKNSAQMATTEKLYYVLTHLQQTNVYALGMGLITIIVIIACKKINKSLPGALIGIIIPIIFIIIFSLDKLGVQLTGNIPTSLPPFKMVNFDFSFIQNNISGALSIAIIGCVEAISSAKSIATLSRQKIDPNQEFIGQGIANIASSFFQGFPGSGSFTRTALNYHSGAVSRLSGVLQGGIMAVVLLFFAPFAKYIPTACLAGVMMVTAYNLVNKDEIKKVVSLGKLKSDSLAMWVTCFATILLPNLSYAIYTGIVLTIMLHLKDTNKAPIRIFVPLEAEGVKIVEKEVEVVEDNVEILIVELEGNLYFGMADNLEQKLDSLVNKSKVFILRMKHVRNIDVTALNALKVFTRSVKEADGEVIICGLTSNLNSILVSSNFDFGIDSNNKFMSEKETFAFSSKDMERARAVLKCDTDNKSKSCDILASSFQF
ncbi:sulfate permease-like transporter, MFS superfamily [Desulfosporosinus acidiphilus SJ4]|uniref:Sulfate permease-like transporter, MFS superfamily n=1 Tax=Desulfosporosinus acidiphilus (strain DSM 22704 / JCM 16185 / SJ4) TaxID=646529 RepID=I4D711_DESAJ|nr:SulP family inorganic anion transporter [Desulfosporosinus acidiphilus]AFM41585.1 sulfate permease-like transporter, MFS superfamily [Desulfosporosinus acidiphilus SJ4]